MGRLEGLDTLRGLAVFLMIVFHFFWNLDFFHFIKMDDNYEAWKVFRSLVVTLFLLSMGISLSLVHGDGIIWKKVFKRGFVLLATSVLITVVSYVMFPQTWIYFGIIHFILFASLCALVFVNHPFIALGVGLGSILGFWLKVIHVHWLWAIFQDYLPSSTMDLVTFFPWFGVVLLGITLYHFSVHERLFKVSSLAFLGRHSLVIYLTHSPLLYFSVYAFNIG